MDYWTETLDRKEGVPLRGKGMHMMPWARLHMAGAIVHMLEQRLTGEMLTFPRSEHRFRSLSRRHLKLDLPCKEEAELAQFQEAWEQFGVRAEQDLGDDVDDTVTQRADELSRALSMSKVESALLRLAMHAFHAPDLRCALDLAGECTDVEVACLFAEVLRLEFSDVFDALSLHNPLRAMTRYDVSSSNTWPTRFLAFPSHLEKVLRRKSASTGDVLACFFRLSPEPKLSMSDFSGMGEDIPLLRRYLEKAAASGRTGVNILLHGKPGTGKTELARTLAKTLGLVLQEVQSMDEDGSSLSPSQRLNAYRASQDILRFRAGTVMLFDEVEDVFPWAQGDFGSFMRSRGGGSGDRNKGLLTEVLESNPRPAIWVGNSIHQMDPAFLRRFDMVLELKGPDRATRQRIAADLFDGVPVCASRVERLAARSDYAIAHIERLANVMRAMDPEDASEGDRILGVLERQLQAALDLKNTPKSAAPLLPYRSDCVNTDCNLDEVAAALSEVPDARLCLYGPPGTGKTQWAHELAGRLDRPLLIRRASDLLDKYVGGTEALIREAFEQAQRDGAILLIDEADSFLQSREGARANWEVAMVNEMLTAMEQFEGIFIASTNLQDRMDPASARRFDFKVAFSALTGAQAAQLFDDLLHYAGITQDELPEGVLPQRLAGTTPGDFANVARQCRLSRSMRTAESLYRAVEKEQTYRHQGGRQMRRMGFT